MKYKEIAEQILTFVGGKDNIINAAHCATRLRLVLKDENIVKVKEIEQIELVKGVFSQSGQFQIIIGQGIVNNVYKEFAKLAGISEMNVSDIKEDAFKKLNPAQKLSRVLSNIFVPIIPAIVASGLLMGLMGTVTKFGFDMYVDSWWWKMLDWFSSSAFIFLPILVAISAAKVFGTNTYLAATMGGIMIHPSLQNAWTQGSGYETIKVLGIIDMPLLGYQGTVLPILFVIYLMSKIEKQIRKIVPEILDILITPLFTVLITGFFALAVIGPMANIIGKGISFILVYSLNNLGIVAGLLFGGVYSSIVITGIHHSFHAIELGLIADTGFNTLLPIWSMANFAQGGAALAVYFITKNQKIKSISLPAAFSSFIGITEAAIFGVNLKYTKPFIAASIGGAISGAYVVMMKVKMTAVGVTGIPAIAITSSDSMIHYILGLLVAFLVSFGLTYIFGIKDE